MEPILFQVTSQFERWPSFTGLPIIEQDLLSRARAAKLSAYAPYSKFSVGAAVLLDNGEVVIGSNQENVAYPAGICGERVAVFAAGSKFPEARMIAIAICAGSAEFVLNHPVAPCGPCRQVLAEYETRQMEPIKLLLQGDSEEVLVAESVASLLPLLFNEPGLRKS